MHKLIQTDPTRKIRICPLASFPEQGEKGFQLELPEGRLAIFVVRQADDYFAYVNSCPHTGVSLDWQPDQFLDASGSLIQCSTHGALFRINDGLCIHGPCLNSYLTRLNTTMEDGDLMLLLPDKRAKNLY